MLTKGKNIKASNIIKGGNPYQTLFNEIVRGYSDDKGLEFKSALLKKDIRFQKTVLKVFKPDFVSCERMLKLGFKVKTIIKAMRIQAHYEAYEYTGIEKYNSIVFEAIYREAIPKSVWYCKKNNISCRPDKSYSNDLYYEWFDEIVQATQDLAEQIVYRPDEMFENGLTIYEKFRARIGRNANKVIEYHGAEMRDHRQMFNCNIMKYNLSGIDNNENKAINRMIILKYENEVRFEDMKDMLVRASLKWEQKEAIIIKLITNNPDIRNVAIAKHIEEVTGRSYNKSTVSRLVKKAKKKAITVLTEYYSFDCN